MPQTDEQTATSGTTQPTQMQVQHGFNFFAVDSDLIGIDRAEFAGHFPEQLFNRYVSEAFKRVEPKRLEDGTWFAEIPGFTGIWASGTDLPATLDELRAVLIDWILLKISHRDRDLPHLNGINLNVIG